MEPSLTRRDLLIGSLAFAGTSLLQSQALGAEPDAMALSFQGRHAPVSLPYGFDKLKGLSERLIKSHYENNYGGAVKALNSVETKLADLVAQKDFSPALYVGFKREQQIKLGSLTYHEHYFLNLGGNGKSDGTEIKKEIEKHFGTFSAWEAEFRKLAAGMAGGSGWVVLGYHLPSRLLYNTVAWDHLYGLTATVPLLVLDMYEHAYHLDFASEASRYIDAFFQNIEWTEVNRRCAKALRFK